jgi:hypothetical protein
MIADGRRAVNAPERVVRPVTADAKREPYAGPGYCGTEEGMMTLVDLSYELKLLVDPDLTLDGSKLKDKVSKAFPIESHKKIVMQFVDSARRELDTAKWYVRIRGFDDEDRLELTYKKRYAITNDDIKGALTGAADDGFETDPDKYEAQVEWGLTSKTLTLSRKADPPPPEADRLDLPGERKSREHCAAKAPEKLKQQEPPGWVGDVFAVAHLYGPVRGERWKCRWKGELSGKQEVSIEVWHIRGKPGEMGKPVVEVSVKEKEDPARAQTILTELHAFLKEKDWLLDEEILKTRRILKRY